MFGPNLIFDKSFIQMLNEEELFELSIFFNLIGTSTLMKEILADLEKEPAKGRIPRDVVRYLAAKMWHVTVEPMNFRKAVLLNLATVDVPMTGAVLLDLAAPNIAVTPGRGIFIDGKAVQKVWERWANGDFSPLEENLARVFRGQVNDLDSEALRAHWKPFAREHFVDCHNVSEIIRCVDDMLDDFDSNTQGEILRTTLDLVRAPTPVRRHAVSLWKAGLMPRMKDLAPYAAAVARISLVYAGCLGRGFIGPRDSDPIDLQYLCYAPFCMAFASADKLHRTLWPSASGRAIFLWGPDLKADLKHRAELRKSDPDRVAGILPLEIPGSIITAAFQELADRKGSGRAAGKPREACRDSA